MIIKHWEVDPLGLMRSAGGSIGAAMRITGDMIQAVIDEGATEMHGLEARASWVAVVHTAEGVGTVEWDPSTPIPSGAFVLRCNGFSAALVSESA